MPSAEHGWTCVLGRLYVAKFIVLYEYLYPEGIIDAKMLLVGRLRWSRVMFKYICVTLTEMFFRFHA